MPELAKAYVQIIPSAEGIKGRLTETLGGEAEGAGENAGKDFSGGFGKAVGTIAKVGAAAIGAAAAAAGALTKQAVEGYADFEQLSGGVETLFKDASGTVMQNASDAFRTAGMTANQYMETVTSFSASLLQSLGGDTAEAASVADMAITDMSDNANKMGTSMESIQAAYQGFAKGQYQLLDNLKLGYGGSASEMQRLLDDATKLSGIDYDISSLSDVYEAIHVIQTELEITGTTAAESSSTISGSLGTLSAAWQNLVTGIANPDADIGALIGDVVSSAEAAAGNLLPAISTALSGVGQLITGLAPQIASAIPGLVSDVLPTLSGAALSLLQAAVSSILDNLPMLLETGLSVVIELANGITSALPELIPVAVETILTLATSLTDPGNIGQLVDAAIAIIIGLANGLISALPQLLAQAPVIIQNLEKALIVNAPKLLVSSVELIGQIVSGIVSNLGEIGRAAGEIAATLLSGLAELWVSFLDAGRQIVEGIWQGISNAASWFREQISGFFKGIVDGVKSALGIASPSKVFAGIGENMAQGLGVGIEDGIDVVEKAVGDMSDAAINAWRADQLNTAIVGTGAYQLSSTAAAGMYDPMGGQASEIVNAVFAIGNMIVSAINDIDTELTIDGDNLANAMYRYNQNAARRHGVAFVE